MSLLDHRTPVLDATGGNPPVASIYVDEFTLHALIGCAGSSAQNPRVRDALIRLLAETERPFATEEGQWCRECGRVVSWVDHLRPETPGGPVECFAARMAEALAVRMVCVNTHGSSLVSAAFPHDRRRRL